MVEMKDLAVRGWWFGDRIGFGLVQVAPGGEVKRLLMAANG